MSVVLAAAGYVRAQTADSSPRFKAATIRPLESRLVDGPRLEGCPASPGPVGCIRPAVPYEGCVGGPGSTDPDQLHCEISLGTFIEMAYHLDPRQFMPPDWMERSWWEVEAASTGYDDQKRVWRKSAHGTFKLTEDFR